MECEKQGKEKIVWDFGQYTSVHGLPRIIQTDCKWVKVIWGIIFAIMCFCFLYSVVTLLIYYLSYATHQNTYTSEAQPKFPSVTVCNANPLRRSKLTGTLATKYGGQAPLDKSEYNAKIEFLSLAAGLSDSDRKAMEHQKIDFLIQCTYNRKSCSTQEVKYYHDPMFGACYTFNNQGKKVTKVGPYAGLDMTINIEEAEYLNHVSPFYGADVAIHDSGTTPPLQEQALYVTPGYQTSVTVSQHEIKRLPAPYGNCKEGGSSFDECSRECKAKAIEASCGCKSPMYETSGNICSGEGTEASCMAAVMDEDKGCDCSSPCEETTYKTLTSFTKWPTQNYEATLEKAVGGISTSLDASIANGKLSQNLLSLKVYFQHLEFVTTEVEPALEVSELLTAIGIAALLYLGCSMISFIEMLEFILLLIQAACKKGKSPQVDKA